MKIINRNVPGHYILADRCKFFIHDDIALSDNVYDTIFCVSSIGEMTPQGKFKHPEYFIINGFEKVNVDSIYEIMVFDKTSENPWVEIEQFRSNNKDEIIEKHKYLVEKYFRIAGLRNDNHKKP